MTDYSALTDHIKQTWSVLRRNALDVAFDAKVSADMRSYLYVPEDEDLTAINQRAADRRQATGAADRLEIRRLPPAGQEITDHGVLYLPHDYIVPGGRFNEMYGWDSYWIVLGLLHDGELALARGMIDNCLYQLDHYGDKILNANRTYYLTRSHPPMLGPMALALAQHLTGADRTAFITPASSPRSTATIRNFGAGTAIPQRPAYFIMAQRNRANWVRHPR